ncbi:MAG: GntR family transcriptional regulator, partial [Gammaproteobacteria bacterium]
MTRSAKKTGDSGRAAKSLTEAATDTIRDRILDLSIEPGQRIDEKLLMERFNLSRTPVREALNRLATDGLVEIQSNRGAFVRPLDVRHIRQLFDAYIATERMV